MIPVNYIMMLRKALSTYNGVVTTDEGIPTITMENGGVYAKFTCQETFALHKPDGTIAIIPDWQQNIRLIECYDLAEVKRIGQCAEELMRLWDEIANIRDSWAELCFHNRTTKIQA